LLPHAIRNNIIWQIEEQTAMLASLYASGEPQSKKSLLEFRKNAKKALLDWTKTALTK